MVKGWADMEKRHILICGERCVGKSTMIEKLINEIDKPVYGFFTRMYEPNEKGFYPIYMFSPTDTVREKTDKNYVADCNGHQRSVNVAVFDDLGLELLKKQEGILVMDELGFMETGSPAFCESVLNHLDGDDHVIATVKARFDVDFLDKVRNHPKALVCEITPENRDEVYEQLLPIVRSWNRE